MSRNSEDWARLEHARRTLPDGSPLKKNIPRFQDELHARNVALAAKENEKKAKLTYDQPSGEWRNTDGERAYKTKGTPQRPLAEGKEYTALDRLGRAGKSIGKSFVGMLPAMVETSQQIAEDTETDSKKPRFVAVQNEAESLRAWLNTVPFETAGKTPEYKQKSVRYQELLEQIKGVSTQTVVDGDKFGQRTMRESARDAAKATEGMTGTGKFLADTGISIANSAVTLPTAAISPAMPLVLMGTQAAAKKTVELNARGIAPKEALGRGIVAGGIEAATEKIPVDTLLDVIKSGGKSALKNILKQAGIEATEEGVSYVAGYLADVAANDPEASFSLEELGANALGGFLSGGFTGAAGTAVGKIGQYVDGRKRAQAARGTPAKTDTARANTSQEAAGAEMRGLLSDAKKDEAAPIHTRTELKDPMGYPRSATSPYMNSMPQSSEHNKGMQGLPMPGKQNADVHAPGLNDHIQNNHDVIAQGGILAELRGDEFKLEEPRLMRDKIADFFKSIGGKVTRKGFGEITLTRSGVRDSMGHGMGPEKVTAFAAVPAVIEHGQIIDTQENWKGRGYDTVAIGGQIKIGGQDYDMGVIVKKYDNADMAGKYYVHEVLLSDAKKRRRSHDVQTGTREGYPSDIASSPINSITQNSEENKGMQGLPAQISYEAQIDGVFNGTLTPAKPVAVGKTPQILRSLGAPELEVTMTQATARKIAYPDGYMGGKHNLGISALKKLPEQINDPVAVLKSKTQPDSLVILTEWNDTSGNPVIAAIHLNKTGMIEDVNSLASAYGKRNLDALLGENNENVIYTKENKSIDQLLSIRLQLPEAMADDTLVSYSITQNGGENKGILPLSMSNVSENQSLQPLPMSRGHEKTQAVGQEVRAHSIPDPGTLNQGTHPDTRDDLLQEIRAESEALLGGGQSQPLVLTAQETAHILNNAAIDALEDHEVRLSDEVRTLDRGNIGQIAQINADGTYEVFFRNSATGANMVKTMHGSEFETITNQVGAPSGQMREIAQNQLDALESDSYLDPERQRQAGAEARRDMRDARRRTAHAEYMSEEIRPIAEAWSEVQRARERTQDAIGQLQLTENDMRFVDGALISGSTANFYEADNPQDALYYFELKQGEKDAYRKIAKYNEKQQTDREAMAAEFADVFATMTRDKSMGIAYQINTMERNAHDIFLAKYKEDMKLWRKMGGEKAGGARPAKAEYTAQAERFLEIYISPVHKAVAEGNRLTNEMRGRIEKLGLSKQESTLVQYLLENEGGGAEQFMRENAVKMTADRQARIESAVQEFRSAYNQIHAMINEAEIRAGYEPTAFRKDYAPHFTDKAKNTPLARAMYRLGFGKITNADDLPTDIAGITEQFRPGTPWFRHAQQRRGHDTVYDAVMGFDQYIESAVNRITLTEPIQQLRALEDAVRYRLSDEQVQAKITEIRNDRTKDALDRRRAMEEFYEEIKQEKDMELGRLVTDLRAYTDNIAGKKSRGDRAVEDRWNRSIYQISTRAEARVVAGMLWGNIRSAMSNVIPLFRSVGEVDMRSVLKGMADTVQAYGTDDGFADGSDFLVNRRGSERLVQSGLEKAVNAGFVPMQFIDDFTSESIVRARVYQNTQKGMDIHAAMDEANSFAAGLMGDRSKGAQPTLFDEKNPVTKALTMFQIEVMNDLMYEFKDMPRRMGEQGAAALAGAVTKLLIGNHLANMIAEEVFRNSWNLDPIGILWRAINPFDEEDEREVGERISGAIGETVEQLPIVGSLLGGGRVPIGAALPKNPGRIADAAWELPKLITGGEADMVKIRQGAEELINPATYLLPPFGGGMVKKAIEGFQTVQQGGSYKMNAKGERELQFPQFGQGLLDYVKAMVGGKYSTREAKMYIDSGFKRLNAEDTAVYEKMLAAGVKPEKAYDTIQTFEQGYFKPKEFASTAENTRIYSPSQKDAMRDWIRKSDFSPEVKQILDERYVGNRGIAADYSSADALYQTTKLAGIENRTRKAMAREAAEYGVGAEQFVQWHEMVDNIDTGDKHTQLAQAVQLIDRDKSMTDEQKEGVKSILLVSRLGQKWTGEYADSFVGGLGAGQRIDAQAAYVRIRDEVRADREVHEKDREEHSKLYFKKYLNDTELGFEEKEKLKYFITHDEGAMKKDWAEIARLGNNDERPHVEAIQKTGLDVNQYKVIKSGLDQIFADKDSKGNSIAGTKKKKLIAYLNEWEGLTYEQKNLLLKMDGQKYGMGEKPKKASAALPTMPRLKGLPTMKW